MNIEYEYKNAMIFASAGSRFSCQLKCTSAATFSSEAEYAYHLEYQCDQMIHICNLCKITVPIYEQKTHDCVQALLKKFEDYKNFTESQIKTLVD